MMEAICRVVAPIAGGMLLEQVYLEGPPLVDLRRLRHLEPSPATQICTEGRRKVSKGASYALYSVSKGLIHPISCL